MCSSLHAQGVGVTSTSAVPVSIEDEDALLDKGVLAVDNPTSLQYMVFFYVGIHCALRGRQEHRNLSAEQFTRVPSDTALNTMATHTTYTRSSYPRTINTGSKIFTVKIKLYEYMP